MTAINSRDIRRLSIDGLRALVRVANNTHEHLNTGDPGEVVDAQAILDLHWAAQDAGYDSFESWLRDLNSEGHGRFANSAKAAWRYVTSAAKARAHRAEAQAAREAVAKALAGAK